MPHRSIRSLEIETVGRERDAQSRCHCFMCDHFGSDHQGGTHDVDYDKDGRLYVADTHNGRVTIYEMTGNKGRLVGELSERIRGPEGVLVHPNGRIYVGAAW